MRLVGSVGVLALILTAWPGSVAARGKSTLQADVAKAISRVLHHGLSQSRSYLPRIEYYYKPISIDSLRGSALSYAASTLGTSPSTRRFSVVQIDCMVDSPATIRRQVIEEIGKQHGPRLAAALDKHFTTLTSTVLGSAFDQAVALHPSRGLQEVNRGTHIATTADLSLLGTMASNLAAKFVQAQPRPTPLSALRDHLREALTWFRHAPFLP